MKDFYKGLKQNKKKKTIFSFNCLLLIVSMVFVCNRSLIVSEVKNLLQLFQLEGLESILGACLLPSKTIIEFSQFVSILCLFEVVFAISITFLCLILFIEIVEKKIIKDKSSYIVCSDAVLSGKNTYKETLRFLC